MTQDLKFCPSAVVGGSFIKTAMTCSHTGGMEGGVEGVIKVGMLAEGLAVGVEASGGGGEPEVRRHKATRGGGYDGGQEIEVEARPGRFQKKNYSG